MAKKRAGQKQAGPGFDADPDDGDDETLSCWLPDEDGAVRLNKGGERSAQPPATTPEPKKPRRKPKR
jgi:hypothetical protein